MIPILRRAVAPTMVLLVGLGCASPALASPAQPIAQRLSRAPSIVLVDCDTGLRNVCYLRMNECLYRTSNRPGVPPNAGEIRACQADYFACIRRYKCEKGPVW